MTELQRLENVLDQMMEDRIDRYMSMFSYLKMFDDPKPATLYRADKVKYVVRDLKKDDRIVWFLKMMRLRNLYGLSIEERDKGKKKTFEDLLGRYRRDFEKGRESRGYMRAATGGSGWVMDITSDWPENQVLSSFRHFLSLDIPEINNTVFDYQTVYELYYRFTDLEREKNKTQERVVRDSGTTLVSFPDGWKWVDLEKPYCSDEGRAMGHCGNKGEPKDSHTVFSLREPMDKKKGTWKPHLTFIFDKDTATLGEMKGYANEKPKPKYYPYIVELLKLPIIKGIESGAGYLPENNFELGLLDDKSYHQVVAANRSLRGYGD